MSQEKILKNLAQLTDEQKTDAICVYGYQMPTDWWVGIFGAIAALFMRHFVIVQTQSKNYLVEFSLKESVLSCTEFTPSDIRWKAGSYGAKHMVFNFADKKYALILQQNAGGFPKQAEGILSLISRYPSVA